MNFCHGLRGLLLVLLCFCSAAQAKALLVVKVEPSNSALKNNIEAYIGDLGERDENALRNFRRSAEEQASKLSLIHI